MNNTCPPAPCPPYSGSPSPYQVQRSGTVGAVSVHSSGPGSLRRASRLIDGRRAYFLESSQGQVILYATEQPGVNMEPYVDRHVELLGQVIPRGDVRPLYLSVSRVVPLP